MTIDVTSPGGRSMELRNVSLIQAKKQVQRALAEMAYLTLVTATGPRRTAICDANIHLMAARDALAPLQSEEAPAPDLPDSGMNSGDLMAAMMRDGTGA